MTRENELVKIRPEIAADAGISEFEIFQNQTLRPILKLQNELLIAVFKNYVQKRKGGFLKLSEKEKLLFIEQSVKRDMKFKHYLEGIVTGHFTLDEYQTFIQNEDELTKRLITLLVQRFQSQLNLLEGNK